MYQKYHHYYFDSLPRRLGDILKRKRRSKRTIMKGKGPCSNNQDTTSNSKKNLEGGVHTLGPHDCSFAASHDKKLLGFASLTSARWSSRTASSLPIPESQLTKVCTVPLVVTFSFKVWAKGGQRSFYFNRSILCVYSPLYVYSPSVYSPSPLSLSLAPSSLCIAPSLYIVYICV